MTVGALRVESVDHFPAAVGAARITALGRDRKRVEVLELRVEGGAARGQVVDLGGQV